MAKKKLNVVDGNVVEVGRPSPAISPDTRQRMIAEAAYYRALQRNFAGGNPVEDWLIAEREINEALLGAAGSGREPTPAQARSPSKTRATATQPPRHTR